MEYCVAVRKPVEGTYRGYEVISMPPSSSGGIPLIQMLNLLESFPIAECGQHSARSMHLGDADFVPVSITGLTSKDYAHALRARIDLDRETQSSLVTPGRPSSEEEGTETPHFSIMDR